MLDVKDDATGGFRRVEILTGPGRRRRWSAEEKSRIVEETLAAGGCVSAVARRWQVCRQQAFGVRRAGRWWLRPLRRASPRHAAFFRSSRKPRPS
ncbi:MAG: transposase [Acetobacteraceae bacterium]